MLGLTSVEQLSDRVGISVHEICHVADHFDRFVRHYELVNPFKPDKPPRPVISTVGPLRHLQDRLLRKLLLPSVLPSPYNHGSVARRNITTNVLSHANSVFAWKTDLSRFFPSIHRTRVYKLFESRLQCSARVSGILTRLCTYDHHLALGLPTSPLLADQIAKPLDVRIAGMAREVGLVYTRFVDDITLSRRFSLDEAKCRLPKLIRRIIDECGFAISAEKTDASRLDDRDFTITALRVHNGRLDVAANYLQEVERQIVDHRSLASGGAFAGLLLTRDMLRSRILFIASIRPTRRSALLRKLGSISWPKVSAEAAKRGLVVARRQLRRVPESLAAELRRRRRSTHSVLVESQS